MNWTTARPTQKQYAKALKAAGLPVNPSEWITAEMKEKAAQALDKAHSDKLEKFLSKGKYNVIKDGNGFGVIDETQTLVNEEPMSKGEAQELVCEMNTPDFKIRYADELPEADYYGY